MVWLALDPREAASGDPVALKPLKFLLSFAIHMATLAWISGLLRRVAANDRWFACVVHVQIACIVIELAAIVVQAARGVESHFYYATAFDRAMLTTMGLGVAVMSLSFVAMLVGLARRPGGSPLALSGLYSAVFLSAVFRTLDGRSALVIDASAVESAGLALLCGAVLAGIGSFIWRHAEVRPLSG